MNSVLNYYLGRIKSNRFTFLLILILFSGLLIWSLNQGKFLHFGAYMLAMALSVLAVDLYSLKTPTPAWEIKKPRKEIVIIAIIFLLQVLVTTCRFVVFQDFQLVHPVIRISLLALMILVIYPVILIVYFFFIGKYKLSNLGLKINKGIWIGLMVITIIGTITFLFVPERVKFQEFFKEYGLLQMIALGFISAAIPEEFVRYIAQTRFAVAFNNKALAWFITGLLWALIHIPNFYSQDNNLVSAVMGAVEILPIGLLWGYMTERLRSIWPSVLVHGTNLWGLQNF